ncbi:phage baseplate assembly protein V [Lysinibacillus xylanilyticus]|uniref:phage baseplate assembly protein V n=1 Tax=Lysinibacillus xylanilyticus TaxID=582475 RepID=UPI003D035204
MRVQVGEVKTVDPAKGTARVKIEEQDGKISSPLRVLYRGAFKNKDYWMPSIEEHVLCLFTKQSEGFIIGAFYDDETPPPRVDPEKRCIEFEDGSFIEYDTKTRKLHLNIDGEINIETKGPVTVNGQLLSSGGNSSTSE